MPGHFKSMRTTVGGLSRAPAKRVATSCSSFGSMPPVVLPSVGDAFGLSCFISSAQREDLPTPYVATEKMSKRQVDCTKGGHVE